jgi:hypothetical protein
MGYIENASLTPIASFPAAAFRRSKGTRRAPPRLICRSTSAPPLLNITHHTPSAAHIFNE